jgi:hypothetical protein
MEIQQILELLLANQKRAEADWDEMKAKMDSNQTEMEAIHEKTEARMTKFEGKMEEITERQTKRLIKPCGIPSQKQWRLSTILE